MTNFIIRRSLKVDCRDKVVFASTGIQKCLLEVCVTHIKILEDSRVLPQCVPQGLLCGQEAFSDWGKESYQKSEKKDKNKERRKDLRSTLFQGEDSALLLRPNILILRATRGTVAEPSSALDIPSEHSAMGNCKVWWLGHTTEGCRNHSDQIRRSVKITQDQGEELKPL